jgi:GNAT superfamily N-acetyltransferase
MPGSRSVPMPPIDLKLLSIRRHAADEIGPLHRIIAECGIDMQRCYGLAHWVPPYPIETMRENATKYHVYGVYHLAEVVGTFTIGTSGWKHNHQFWNNPNHRPLYLTKFATRPSYQGGGIGSWCIKKVEDIARDWECQAVRFDAIARHVKLIRFYENLGYLAKGRQVVKDWCKREWEIVCFEKVLAGG